jgi:hypothetical protein
VGNEEKTATPVHIVAPASGCVTISAGDRMFEVCCNEAAHDPDKPPEHGVHPEPGVQPLMVEGTVELDALDVDWTKSHTQAIVRVVE